MPLSFTIHENMRGLHHFVDPTLGDPCKDSKCSFELDWGGPLPADIMPSNPDFLFFQATGNINIAKLTSGAVPCSGTLRLDYFDEHKLTYDLDFTSDGDAYHFHGEKIDVKLWHPIQLIKTHTTCYGEIKRADGTIISRSVLHFPFNETLPFLASFRLHWT